MRKITLVLLLMQLGLVAGYAQLVHDPVAIKAAGKYIVFCTGPGVTVWSSNDLVKWEQQPQVLNPIPQWCKKLVPRFDGHIWAPDISFHNGQYYLYYSISSFGSNLSVIGVATNKTLDTKSKDFKWVDHGPVIKSVPGRNLWNAIDPNLVFDDEGTPWMSFGSFWSGLKLVKMDTSLLSVAEPQEWHTISRRERNFSDKDFEGGSAAIEAPFIFKKNGYYYQFVSFDLCCKDSASTYHVRVGRSKKVTGPYYDKDGDRMDQGGGTVVIKGGNQIGADGIADNDYFAIGHNSAYTFDGTDYMFSHGYEKTNHGLPKLLVHEITWDDQAWPILTKRETK